MREDVKILRQRAALECPTFPQPLTIPSPRTTHCRDSGLPHDTRNIMGTSGNVFERLPARGGPPSALTEKSKNLASSSRGLRPEIAGHTMVPESESGREPQNSSILVPRFQRGSGILHHTGGTFSHGGMMDYTRFPISENSHYGISKLESQLQHWSMFKISRSSSHNALDQRNWDSKVNRRTCDIEIYNAANRFPWIWYVWCDDCVCIGKAAPHSCALPKESKCRRATRWKIRPSLTKETNYMVYEHFRAWSSSLL